MRLITRLRTASLLNTIWHHPHLLYGKGAVHEQSFERLLQRLDYASEYIRHPYGPNQWPDFHLNLDGRPQAIELKTTQTHTISMGGTWPHRDCIYIISHTHTPRVMYMGANGVADNGRITIVRGSDLIDEETKEAYEDYRDTIYRMERIKTSTMYLQPRINLRIKIDMSLRHEWYERTLQWIMEKPTSHNNQ